MAHVYIDEETAKKIIQGLYERNHVAGLICEFCWLRNFRVGDIRFAKVHDFRKINGYAEYYLRDDKTRTNEWLPIPKGIYQKIKNHAEKNNLKLDDYKILNQELEEANSQIQVLSKQLEETEREVLLDALTGLNNRKAFDIKINDFCEKFDKNEGFFSVVMLDIDFFKKFNDQYGHQIGDEMLCIVGSHLRENLKGKDFPARYGGEEFIILLANTTLHNACVVADQIREKISKTDSK